MGSPEQLIVVASTIAAILFLSVMFGFSYNDSIMRRRGVRGLPQQLMPSTVFGMALQKLRKYTSQLLQQVHRPSNTVDGHMLVWLMFIEAITSELGPVTVDPREVRHTFLSVCSQYSLVGFAEVQGVLSGFLYDSELMDSYLAAILEP